MHTHHTKVLMPKAKTERTHGLSHFYSSSMDIKLKYLLITTIYVTNSKYPNLVKSLHCLRNVRIPKSSYLEPLSQRASLGKHTGCDHLRP